MTSSIQAGGMILGALPAAGGEALLEEYLAGGIRAFLLPGALLAEPERLAALAGFAKRRCSEAGLGRALVALGGGKVAAAAPPELPGLPSAMSLASRGDRGAARRAGRAFGAALAALGVDLLFAPRLDLANDPKLAGGVLELFGEDSLKAGALAAAFGRGLAEGGVAPCGLSFPGCGALASDGRHGPPLVPFPLDRLAEIEALPFAKAIRLGLSAVLVGRVLAPAIEPERIPAARSVRAIEGRLRTDLGFGGLVIGAALDDDLAGPGRAAVLGALAGCDLQVALGPEAAMAAASALAAALAAGELPAPRLVVARRRLDRLFAKLPAKRPDPAALGRLLSGPEPRRVAERGITAFRAGKGFPLSAAPGLVLLFEPPPAGSEAALLPAVEAALRRELPDARILRLPAEPGPAAAESLLAAVAEAGRVPALALSYDAHRRPGQESLIHLLEESLGEVGVVALRDPYDAAFFPRAAALGAAYGFSAETARAAARLATGRLEGRGRCPVAVLGIEV
ncbi:MAG: hypothetical protein JNG85_04495 [Spirochaetaceae bacterium]|nr:hypothetical protein [Spirochaetaceae bacterium]